MSLSIDGSGADAKEVRISCTLASWLEHGPGVVATANVARVDLTDRAPLMLFSSPPKYRWVCGKGDDRTYVPAEVFAHMPGGPLSGGPHRTEQDARDDLSEALIAWAKQKAGVKP